MNKIRKQDKKQDKRQCRVQGTRREEGRERQGEFLREDFPKLRRCVTVLDSEVRGAVAKGAGVCLFIGRFGRVFGTIGVPDAG